MSTTENKHIESLDELEWTEHGVVEYEWGWTHEEIHIPAVQWDPVFTFFNDSIIITNTTLSTLLLLVVVIFVAIFAQIGIKTKSSRIKMFFKSYIWFFYNYLKESFEDDDFARKKIGLIVGLFTIVFVWNIMGLIIDWIGLSISINFLHYFRPMNSDLNTSWALALISVVSFLAVSVQTKWVFKALKEYLWNFHWWNLFQKFISVFVGWLHIISIPATLASLALRLFGNILAWAILVSVITALWIMASKALFNVWILLAIPFWFFEILVSLVQAIVFTLLTIEYIKQSRIAH